MTLTCHFWDDHEKKLCSKVSDCGKVADRHTVDNLCSRKKKVLQDCEIKEVIVTVTDIASNIVKATRDAGLRQLPCYTHMLNLVVSQAIEATTALASAKEQISRLVSLTKRSNVVSKKLDKYQKDLGQKPKKLIKDMPTRLAFNLKTAIMLLLSEPEVSEEIDHLSGPINPIIEQAVDLLQPCFEATTEL